jgi:hypothetical protein
VPPLTEPIVEGEVLILAGPRLVVVLPYAAEDCGAGGNDCPGCCAVSVGPLKWTGS